jgi:hypothetical protein
MLLLSTLHASKAQLASPPDTNQGSDCPAHDRNEGQLEVGGGPSLPSESAASKGAEDDVLRQIEAIPDLNVSVDALGLQAVKGKEPQGPKEPSSRAVSGPTQFDNFVRDFRRSLTKDIRKLGTVQPDQLFHCRVCETPNAYNGLNTLRHHAGTVRQLPWRHAALGAAIVQVIEEATEGPLDMKGGIRDPQSLEKTVEVALRRGLGPRAEQEEVIGKAGLDTKKGEQQTELNLRQEGAENAVQNKLREQPEADVLEINGEDKEGQRPENGTDRFKQKAESRETEGDGKAGSGRTDAEQEDREGQRRHKGEEVPVYEKEKDVEIQDEGLREGTRRDQKGDELEDGKIRGFEALKIETPEKAAESKHDNGVAETAPTEASDDGRKDRDGKGAADRNEKNGGAETDERKKDGVVIRPSSVKIRERSTSAGAELEGDLEQSWVVQVKENLPMGASKKKKVTFPTIIDSYGYHMGTNTVWKSVRLLTELLWWCVRGFQGPLSPAEVNVRADR